MDHRALEKTMSKKVIDVFDNITDGQHVEYTADGCVVTILIADLSILLCLLTKQQEFEGKHFPEDKKYPLY